MQIRKAAEKDFPQMLPIYERARQFMRETGNPNQWKDCDPKPEVILEGIREGKMYLVMALESDLVTGSETNLMTGAKADLTPGLAAERAEEKILGAFYFALEEEITYRGIYDGKWMNEEPYGVIHRVASAGSGKGFAGACFAWCEKQCLAAACRNLRIDTHEDNKVMQHVLEKNGFTYCGKIHLKDGSERLAYQKVLGQ